MLLSLLCSCSIRYGDGGAGGALCLADRLEAGSERYMKVLRPACPSPLLGSASTPARRRLASRNS